MKRLERLTNIVRNEVKEAMRDALMQEKTRVLRLVNVTADIQVDIDIMGEDATVCVYNRNHIERYYPNIEERIVDVLPHWDEVALSNIWDNHGFADEYDYMRWRYGA